MEPIKVAMIGLDTSHCVELPRRLHSPDLPANEKIDGMKIVAVNRFETPFQGKEGLYNRQAQLEEWGIKVTERKLALEEVVNAAKDGSLKEIFASGTAAVISPIGCLNYKGTDYVVADEQVGPVAQKLYDTLYGIQTGTVEDFMGWTYPLGLKA